ncbi:AGAP002435-PA [Anopheles gambiae str. PEST]|uniref:AGAP002435-PA n=1 Tax=Anopheles gambiae TaxID=7165 RepID=A7USV6_ANOGA|nr:AGAP002435-PA [Anopheles gambiae str. PEST]
MSSLRVKCVFCGLIIDCQREDTAKLLAHLRNEHSEMGNHKPTAFTTSNRSKAHPAQPAEKAELEEGSDASFAEGISESEELLHRERVGTGTSSDTASKSSSSEDAETIPPHRSTRPLHVSLESQRSVLYQTSLSCWRPGGRPVCCPDCGAHRVPIVRSHATGVTWSSTVASCFLFCWPLCCLSWFFSEPVSEYLHCARCDQLLAKHDIKAERVSPNYAMLDRVEDQL